MNNSYSTDRINALIVILKAWYLDEFATADNKNTAKVTNVIVEHDYDKDNNLVGLVAKVKYASADNYVHECWTFEDIEKMID